MALAKHPQSRRAPNRRTTAKAAAAASEPDVGDVDETEGLCVDAFHGGHVDTVGTRFGQILADADRAMAAITVQTAQIVARGVSALTCAPTARDERPDDRTDS